MLHGVQIGGVLPNGETAFSRPTRTTPGGFSVKTRLAARKRFRALFPAAGHFAPGFGVLAFGFGQVAFRGFATATAPTLR